VYVRHALGDAPTLGADLLRQARAIGIGKLVVCAHSKT
jgi:hypothetical protein